MVPDPRNTIQLPKKHPEHRLQCLRSAPTGDHTQARTQAEAEVYQAGGDGEDEEVNRACPKGPTFHQLLNIRLTLTTSHRVTFHGQ